MKKTAKKTAKVKKPAKPAKAAKKPAKSLKANAKPALGKMVAKLASKVVAKATKMTEKAAKTASAGAAKGTEKGKPLTKAEKKAEVLAQLAAAGTQDEKEVVLTNAEGKQYCRVHDCDNEGNTDSYCRFHYLALWKRNKIKAKILQGGKLDKYIEDLTNRYPDKYLEMLRKDLTSEKDFAMIVAEMDLEDSGDEAESEEEASRFIEEVRGGVPAADDDEGSF
jgi:hypothetical protein